MAISSSALVVLTLACSIVVALTQSDTCCDDSSSSFSPFPGSTSSNTLNYRKALDGTVSTDGDVSVGYTSPRCGSCATATYNLKPKSCKYDGSLPAVSGFKCSYYLTYVSSGFTDKKETRSKQPCYYTTVLNKSVNDTHYEQCTVSYMGVASSVFSISGPGSVATVSCQGLVASPKSCGIYSSIFDPTFP